MKIKVNMYKAVTAVAVMAVAFSIPAEAQFLNKISKGLEKLNKGLEKVEKALNTDKTDNKTKKTSNDGSQNSSSNSSQSRTGVSGQVNESGWKKMEPKYRTPYFTPNTKYMKIDWQPDNYSDVHDGVFAIKNGLNCEFWKVTGEKLFDADWRSADELKYGGFPYFSGGVASAKKATPNADGKLPICLLYLDGSVRELDPSYETVSPFMDGIALVTAKINYKEKYFYIDAAGNKLYPNLNVDRAVVKPMRRLRDGLRAFYGTDGTPNALSNWGFIDSKGNIKIKPTYSEVSDFCNGYAWVTTSEHRTGVQKKELIDVNGKVYFTINNTTTKTSNVSDGVFVVVERDRDVYYDLSGKELKSYHSASGFYDGYAFYSENFAAYVIDRNFNIIREMPDDLCNANDVDYNRPNFEPLGIAVVHKSAVINPKGNIILVEYDNHDFTYIGGFRNFTESGYAKAAYCKLDGKDCSAFIRPDGEIAWLFSRDYEPGKIGDSPLPPPSDPVDPLLPIPIPGPQPLEPIIIDNNQKAIGPKVVQKVSFNVKAVANPPEGGIVSLSSTGPFKFGDYVTISASANKDWGIQYVETDVEELYAPKIGEPFAVIADQTITVNFVKKEDEEAPQNFGSYIGQLTFEEFPVPVYAEINQKGTAENPYGNDNYGFVSIMFDPEKRYVDKKGEIGVNFFAVPLKIVGIQKDKSDPSRQWLILDGGFVTAHDIKVSPNGNPLMGLMINMMMAADGFTSVNTEPRRYRVEMHDINPTTGEFTFGPLQTYSRLAGGWVSGGDEVLKTTTKGFFASKSEKGYPGDTFEGSEMKKCDKRNDILWYPPESWSKDKSVYQQWIESMRASYRNAESDYEKIFSN